MTDDATRTLGKGESPLDSCPRAGGAGWLDVGSGGAVAGPWLADQRSGEEDRGSSGKKTRAKKKGVLSGAREAEDRGPRGGPGKASEPLSTQS